MAGIRPGDVVAGKFRVERVLGEGGMGYVVAARHLQLGQMVALKFMREEICTPDYISRFLREARNTVRLKSKHVGRVLDVGSLESGSPYMVMEYLEEIDLSELLQKRGPVPAHEACEYILQACEAIAEAHGYNIVHRDLKPANLFLTRGQSGEPIVKVLDFGVSKVVDLGMEEETNPGGRPRERPDSVVTKATDLLGSPSYMAPEQIVSARDADAYSDVWSLGVILFRLISGKAPFAAPSLGELIQQIMHGPIPNLRDLRPDLPAGLEDVVARCLQRDRHARGDVTDLARLLAPYAGPVATPSLERIALLGPALLAAAPPPPPSHPSFNSASRNAWTTPPVNAPVVIERRRDLTATTAMIWGGVFVVALLCSAVMIAKILGRPSTPPLDPASTEGVVLGVDSSTQPSLPSADPAGTAASTANAANAAGTVTPALTAPVLRPSGHASSGRGKVRPPPPRGDKPPSGPDIPATRE